MCVADLRCRSMACWDGPSFGQICSIVNVAMTPSRRSINVCTKAGVEDSGGSFPRIELKLAPKKRGNGCCAVSLCGSLFAVFFRLPNRPRNMPLLFFCLYSFHHFENSSRLISPLPSSSISLRTPEASSNAFFSSFRSRFCSYTSAIRKES